jgi:hypothetical protein
LRKGGGLDEWRHQERSEQQGHFHHDTLQLFSAFRRRKRTPGQWKLIEVLQSNDGDPTLRSAMRTSSHDQ